MNAERLITPQMWDAEQPVKIERVRANLAT
jgi:hypothetical protein